MKRKIIFTYAILFICTVAQSQSFVSSVPDYILPFPESQTFQRFKGFEPDYSTGAANVSIPLHTLKCGDFSLPITLGYQSNGIKVEGDCYPMGYGWMLHPGLRITRTVRGRPDERYPNKTLIPTADDRADYQDLYTGNYTSDTQHDIFTICLPEGNCTFLIKKADNNSLTSPWEIIIPDGTYQVKVLGGDSFENTDIYGFIVTDSNGAKYYFGDENSTSKDYVEYKQDPDAYKINTAFFLRKIIVPGNQQISFKWNKFLQSNTNGSEYQAQYVDFGKTPSFSEMPIYSDYVRPSGLAQTLTEIVSPDFRIEYGYTSTGAVRYLTGIYVYNISNPNTPVKTIRFDIEGKLLQSLSINNTENYSFEYYNPQGFDNYRARDFWGYYNGANNNRLYPTVSFPTYNEFGIPNNTLYTVAGADRKPHENFVQANLLKRITYPTGGHTTFTYEPNKYNFCICSPTTRKMSSGGGVRLTQMASYTSEDDQNPVIKTYKYGRDEDGYGICSVEPNEETFLSEILYIHKELSETDEYGYRSVNILNESAVSEYLVFNPAVWYDYVTEYTNEGKIVYTYGYPTGTEDSWDKSGIDQFSIPSAVGDQRYILSRNYYTFGINEYSNIFDRGPRLASKKIYNSSQSLLFNEEYQYSKLDPGYTIQNIHLYKSISDIDNPIDGINNEYDVLRSTIKLLTCKLEKTTKTEVVQYGNIQTEIMNAYGRGPYHNIAWTKTTNSNNKENKVEYLYAYDDLSELSPEQKNAASSMLRYNSVTAPLCIKKIVGNNQLARKVIQYQLINTNGDSLIVPEKEYIKYDAGPEEMYVRYTNYNGFGTPTRLETKNGLITFYLWDPTHQYPLAKITSGNSFSVSSTIETNVQNHSFCLTDNKEGIDSDISYLSQQLAAYLNNANYKVDLYTYAPLIGMTSHTDTNGTTTYYGYDASAHLKDIRDKDNNILKHYNYQFINQNNQ